VLLGQRFIGYIDPAYHVLATANFSGASILHY